MSVVCCRGIVLANLPGDGADIIYVLMDEFLSQKAGLTEAQRIAYGNVARGISAYNGHQCSNFGIWGSRTVDGDVFSARNLDWLPDLGINKYKLLTVHHPKDGVAHVTVGYAAVWGALAGMSAQGLSVHEANLEESQVTFRGFPWILRLRHAMANSPTGMPHFDVILEDLAVSNYNIFYLSLTYFDMLLIIN